MGGALAAPAQCLDLEHLHPVGELDEPGRAGEHPGAEVGEDAEAEHVELQLVDDPGQLVDLLGGVELRLVADQVVDPPALGQGAHHELPEVELRSDLLGVVGQPEPARDLRLAGPVVAGEDPPHPAARGVVVVGLERQRALAGVHGPGEELQFGHGRESCHSGRWGRMGAMTGPLISAAELLALVHGRARSDVTVLDVRYRTGGPPGAGEHLAGHVPGAAYVDLDRELAAPPGDGGRHPLPRRRPAFGAAMRRAGRPPATARSWCTTTGPARPRAGPGGCCATTGTPTCGCSTAAGRPGGAAGGPVETGEPDVARRATSRRPRPRCRWWRPTRCRRAGAGRRPGPRALPRRDRAGRPGRRPHPGRAQRADRPQPRPPRACSARWPSCARCTPRCYAAAGGRARTRRRPATVGGVLRLGRDRRARRDRARAARRPGRALPGQLERLDHRPRRPVAS